METGSVIPVMDIGKGSSGTDGNFMWIFFLFFLLAAGGGGLGGGLFGGGNAAQAAEANGISNDFMYANLNNSLGRVEQTTVNGFAGVNAGINGIEKGLCNLGYTDLANFKDLSSSMDKGFCETNRNIDASRYEALRNTQDIIQAGNANTQAILSKLCDNEIQALRDKVSNLENQNSNLVQSRAIVEQLRPYPQPAYIVSSPYGCTPSAGAGV